MPTKTSQVLSWHQSTAQKRMLRKRKIGRPDVYPQDDCQENNLSYERIRKGYQVDTMPFEHESLVYNSSRAKLDRLDEAREKSTELLASVLQRRDKISHSLDKERRKSKDTIGAQLVYAKAKERSAWFAELARGKALHKLVKNVPRIKRQEEVLEYLCDYRVPPFRALWYLKVTAVLNESLSGAKQQDSVCDIFCSEYRNLLLKSIKGLVAQMLEVDDLSASSLYKDRWLYISNLSKCAFEDGIIERQGFLSGLCDIFLHNFITRSTSGKLPHLKVYLLFLSQFLRHITNNLILTRRLAHMITMKLRLFKLRYDEHHNRTTKGAEAFAALTRCQAHRPIIHILVVILQNMVIDVPGAFVWNKFKVLTTDEPSYTLLPFSGSPLDLLPCAVHKLPLPLGKGSQQFVELVKLRNAEIIRRSQAVQDKWSFNFRGFHPFAKLVNVCLDVIGVLDSTDVLEADIIPIVARQIFEVRSDKWAEEIAIRIKLMLQWAVTAEREGSHRAVIVAKIVHQQVRNQHSDAFGSFHLQDLILNYLNTEAPTPGSRFYDQEFASLIILLTELSRFKLFDHDSFVKEIIKTGEVDYRHPVMEQLKSKNETADTVTSSEFEELTPDEFADHKQEEKSERAFLNDAILINHRILIQMPLRQDEEHRNEANQRALLLYGMGDARENHILEMKKIAREICKIWQKKIYVRFECDKAPLWKQSVSAQRVSDTLKLFKSQTYYDQAVICGWCAESFSEMIHDFVQGNSLKMPTPEGLDILCGMFETAQNIFGIFEMCAAITPLLPYVEKVIRSLVADVIPGSMSGQLGYVFLAYMSRHWLYFLHSGIAPTITNQLYRVIEPMIRAYDYPMTSWGRTIAAFVYHSKKQLKKSKLSNIKLYAARENFRSVFNHGSCSCSGREKYNSLFFKDVFEKKLRFFSYHEYKKRLPSLDQLHNRYSFIINSFIAAKDCKRDYDRLSDLATFCGHISAQIPSLGDDWIAATKVLCLPEASETLGYSELLAYVDVKNHSTIYPLATFVMLLAGKYAFSVPRLIAELLNTVFPVMEQKLSCTTREGHNVMGGTGCDYEPGAFLALLILAQISCATDEPFQMPEEYAGEAPRNKLLPRCADELILSMVHWCEMDKVLFPVLSSISILMNALHERMKDMHLESSQIVDLTNCAHKHLILVLETIQRVICEEDWVTVKMFKIAETKRMEAFNYERLKQNCLGQQLLRLGLRRKSERDVISELNSCSENSKIELIRKLLTSLNMWNMRATLFELMLMVKEVSPESAAEGDALMSELARCSLDLFSKAKKEDLQLFSLKHTSNFRFRHVSNSWLIAFLVRLFPQLSSIPQFQHVSVSGTFLKEVSSTLDIANDNLTGKGHQSKWLLSQHPLLKLVQICWKREDSESNKDLFISSLYKQLRDLMNEARKNPARLEVHKSTFERERFLLLLSLVGSVFKEICKPQHIERWSRLFFEIMLCGVVSPNKDRIIYDCCYDMLSILILWSVLKPLTAAQGRRQGSEAEPYDSGIIRKLKKEIGNQRIPSELRGLLHLFPIPKNIITIFAMEPCGASSAAENRKLPFGTAKSLSTLRRIRYGLCIRERMRISSFDFVTSYLNGNTTKDRWKWSWFQASKIDRLPYPVQKWVAKLLFHRHQLEYERTKLVTTTELNNSFITPSDVKVTSETASPLASSTRTPAASGASADATGVITRSEETVTLHIPGTTFPAASYQPMNNEALDQERPKVPSLNRKCGPTNKQPSSETRQKRARRNSAAPLASSFDESRTSTDTKSYAMKDPTKYKIQEFINRKQLEAPYTTGMSAEFPGPSTAISLTAVPQQTSYPELRQQMSSQSSYTQSQFYAPIGSFSTVCDVAYAHPIASTARPRHSFTYPQQNLSPTL